MPTGTYTEAAFEVLGEISNARAAHRPTLSSHEAFAVLAEEVDELWDEVKKNGRKHPERMENIRKEAKQVAAMAIAMMVESNDWKEDA